MSYRSLFRSGSKWLSDLLPSSSSKHLSARGSSKHSSIHGSYSGGGKNECDEGISLAILVATLAGIGVLAYTLFTKITMIGRRRRETETGNTSLANLSNSLLFGTKTYFFCNPQHLSQNTLYSTPYHYKALSVK